MKKTFLNFAAVAVIAAASFVACDQKQSNTDAAQDADTLATADTVAAPVEQQPAQDADTLAKDTVTKAEGQAADEAK